jgi:hypothetical protein
MLTNDGHTQDFIFPRDGQDFYKTMRFTIGNGSI